MLTPIDKTDIPRYRHPNKSPNRQFAEKTIRDFLEQTKVGDVMEVTGYPVTKDDPIKNLEGVCGAFRNELFYMDRKVDLRDQVSVFRRKDRLFMERKAEFIPLDKQGRNPYPGDLPQV